MHYFIVKIGFTFYYYGKVFQLVKPFFIGLSLITLFFIHDVLVAVHVLNSQMIFPYGLLAFFLFYAIIIARRYQKAFETNKQLYKTISSINDQLEEQNIILEEIVEERTVGPSLGQENIDLGMTAIIWGFCLVLAFMILYYRGFGVVANICASLIVVPIVAGEGIPASA